MKRLSKILLLVSATLPARSQDPFYLSVDKSKGLPSNRVYHILQDRKGFIWIATDAGLCRYDGFEFRQYNNRQLSSRAGSNIHEDKYGRIWYQNFDGYLYYVSGDTLKAFQQHLPRAFLRFGITENRIFVPQKQGIDIYRLDNLSLVKTIRMNMDTLSFTQQSNDCFWLNERRIARLDTNGTVMRTALPGGNQSPRLLQVGNSLLALTADNKMWYDIHSGAPVYAFGGLPELQAQEITFCDSNIWYCTTSGLYATDMKGQVRNGGKPFFPDKNISFIMKDREHNYWISTVNEGILMVPDMRSKRLSKIAQPYSLCTMGSDVFVGTRNDELYRFRLCDATPVRIWKGNSNKEVFNLHVDSSRKSISFSSQGFHIISYSGKERMNWPAAVKDLVTVDAKYYAYAASGVVGLLSPDKGTPSIWDQMVQSHRTSPDKFLNGGFLEGVRGKSVAFNRNTNSIYFATNNGLYRADTGSFKELRWNGNSVFCSRLVSYENMIYGLDPQNRVIEIDSNQRFRFSDLNRLLSYQEVQHIKADGNNLFLFTDRQLFLYHFLTKSLQLIPVNLRYTELSDAVCFEDKIIASGKTGLLLFDSSTRTSDEPQAARFVLNETEVNNSFRKIEGSSLRHFENNIAIHYSILCFKVNTQVALYYKINDQRWELCSPETRSLKLASLQPNDYTILFRLGTSGAPQATLHFRILKPLWLRTWFLASVLLAFICLTILYYRVQMGKLRKRNKLLTEKIDLEKNLNSSILTSIRSQMNPHFFYNALNTIQSFIYSGEKQNASSFLSKFSRLTRMILEMSNKERVPLREELEALHLYLELEQVRFQDDFEFHILTDQSLDQDRMFIPSMLIQPYVENAIKHGLLHKEGVKRLTIHFRKENDMLIVSIEDNGIGRKRSSELNAIRRKGHESFSSSANEKRLRILNLDKKVQTVVEFIDKTDAYMQPAGTTVILRIPIEI